MQRCWPALLLCACGSGENSVAIIFPNAMSESTLRRLRVEAYPPETGAAAATERDCSDFVNLAREGKDPIGNPVRGDYTCPEPCSPDWLDLHVLENVPNGQQIVYVLGYSTIEEGATPVLEGCTADFDSEGGKDDHVEVEVALKLVIPDSARMMKSAGDRQVGRANEQLAVPLEVRVEADSPSGVGGTYVIPGVPVEFTSDRPGFDLIGNAATYSDASGHASIGVQLPGEPGNGRIIARSMEIETFAGVDRATQTFSVSVTSVAATESSETIASVGGSRTVSIALGDVGGNAGLDLVVLGCDSANERSCIAGQAAELPLGTTSMKVILDVGTNPVEADVVVPGGLGVLPASVVIADVSPPAGREEIAVLNSRRADCAARECEGSELVILRENAGDIVLDGRYTMTGSNAVGLTSFATSRSSFRALAIAAQGRSRNSRPCSRANRCLPINPTTPEQGGCPPAERCECANCNSTNEPGICVARDKMIDLLVTEAQQLGTVTFNRGGCQISEVSCDNTAPDTSMCDCFDTSRMNGCTGRDGCNCKVPARIYIGDTDAPVLPFGLAAGPTKGSQDWDIVVPSIGGLELIEARPTAGDFDWRGEPIINAPIHAAAIVDLDFAMEEQNGDPHRADVVWFARSSCLLGSNFVSSCPVWRAPVEGTTPVACLGVYYTDGQSSIFDLRTPALGGCRRHHLDFLPHGMCTGDFNGDQHVDTALSSRDRNQVYVFSGDGRGGLLDPPDVLLLPAGGVGGPMACGDVDGDAVDDILVANAESGSVYLLRMR